MEISQVRYSEFKNYHPLVNLMYFILTVGLTMFSSNPFFVMATFVLSWIYSVYLKGVVAIKFNFLCLLPIIIFMVVINVLFVQIGETPLFYIGDRTITLEAISFGVCASMLLCAVIIWFSCFNVILTSDKLIYLFGKITPVLGLTISMIFRFIPLLKKRFQDIKLGQTCMGRSIRQKSLIKKIRQFGKEVSILISWSLEASIETADSMEARGYGLKGRTSFNNYKWRKKDVLALIYMGLFGVLPIALCVIGQTSTVFYPKFQLDGLSDIQLATLISYFMMILMPIFIDIKEEIKWKRLNLKV